MHVYLDITSTPPVDIFAGGCCVAAIGDPPNESNLKRADLDAWAEAELAGHGLARATLVVPEIDKAAAVLDGTYQAVQADDGAWTWVAQARPLTEDELTSLAEAAMRLMREEAQRDLGRSDMTVLRCVEAGVSLPAEWVAYRAALRAIASGGPGPVPGRPSYPAGT